MNTTASYSSEHSSFRRCSTESILSLQGQETDFVRDTSDTDEGRDVEYEPVTESESELDWESEESSVSEIITTKVIAVSVGDEGDLEFADSEQTDSEGSDSELDLNDYWQCAGCGADNNNPVYRFCETCFKVRKSLFPPRPKRKRKRAQTDNVTRTLSHDSGVESQELSQQDIAGGSKDKFHTLVDKTVEKTHVYVSRPLKRRAESVDRSTKRFKSDQSESESEVNIESNDNFKVQPLVKTVSDPSVTIDEPVILTKRAISDSLKDIENDNLCIICCAAPKSGIFVHGRVAHICCCYRCASKVWSKKKRCPICNSKISNVLKAVVL